MQITLFNHSNNINIIKPQSVKQTANTSVPEDKVSFQGYKTKYVKSLVNLGLGRVDKITPKLINKEEIPKIMDDLIEYMLDDIEKTGRLNFKKAEKFIKKYNPTIDLTIKKSSIDLVDKTFNYPIPKHLKQKYMLKNPENFFYTKNSGVFSQKILINKCNLAKDFNTLIREVTHVLQNHRKGLNDFSISEHANYSGINANLHGAYKFTKKMLNKGYNKFQILPDKFNINYAINCACEMMNIKSDTEKRLLNFFIINNSLQEEQAYKFGDKARQALLQRIPDIKTKYEDNTKEMCEIHTQLAQYAYENLLPGKSGQINDKIDVEKIYKDTSKLFSEEIKTVLDSMK